MPDIVKKLTIRSSVEGADRTQSDLKGIQQGYEGVAQSAQKAAQVTETASKSGLSTAETYRRQTLRLDETAKAADRMAREIRIADQFLAQGGLTAGEHAERLALIQTRYAQAGAAAGTASKGIGLARHEMVNLSRQAQDIGVSLASGQSPFTVLVQQGTQVADIFASSQGSIKGFFSQVGAGIGSVVTPFRALSVGIASSVALVAGLASAYQDAKREIERALMGVGRASGATVADIERFATTSQSAYGLTVSGARDAATAFAATGRIYGENIGLAASSVAGFARITGTDAADAVKALTQAYTEGAAGADRLNSVLGHLDGRTREHIANLFAQGRAQEGQKAVIQGVIVAVRQSEQALGPLEKAWLNVKYAADAAWEAAKRGANVVTGGNAPTGQDRLEMLRGQRDQIKAQDGAPTDSRFFSPVSAQAIRQLNDEIKMLEQSLEAAAKASGDARFKQMSTDADAVVRSIIPQIDQLKALEAQYNRLREAQANSEVSGRMGHAGALQESINALDLQIMKIEDARSASERQNAETLRLVDIYGNVSVATAQALNAMQQQLSTAQAVTGAERMAAQERANYNMLIQQGVAAEQAATLATQQRAIAQAQINANAQAQLLSLQDQVAVAGAYNEQEKISAQYVATRNQLIRDGVNPALAEQVAQMEAAVAQQAEMVRQAKEYEESQRRASAAAADAAADTNSAMRARIANYNAMVELEETIRRQKTYLGGFDLADFTLGVNLWRKDGGYTQFNPAGYKSGYGPGPSPLIGAMSGQYGIDRTGAISLNQGGLTGVIDRAFSQGGGVMDAISAVLDSGAMLDQTMAQTLQQLTDLLPDSEKIGVIEREIARVKEQPISFGRETLLKQLTDSLDQLKQSTDALNATLTLSDLYNTDPRTSHIGFRAGFASGGSFVVPGGYSANDNYMAHIPVASGEEVKINRKPGRDGAIVVPVTQNFYGQTNANAQRKSAFQTAQVMARQVQRGARR